MNLVDVIIIAVLAIATLIGFRQGFILEVAGIAGAIFALVVAKAEYLDLRHMLAQFVSSSRWLTQISYLLIFLFVWAAVILVARRIRFLVRLLLLGGLDRLGGAIVGLLEGLVVVELLIALGLRAPNHNLHFAIRHSALGPTFEGLVPYVDRLFPPLKG